MAKNRANGESSIRKTGKTIYKNMLSKGRVNRLEAKGQPKGLSVKTVRNIH